MQGPSDSRELPLLVRRLAIGIVSVVGVVAILGCVTFRTTGADSVEDFAAEDRYRSAYAAAMASVQHSNQAFLPSGGDPGPCNKGGSAIRCVAADMVLISALVGLKDALADVPVPPRFVVADKMLKAAIDENIHGLQLRDKSLAERDDAAFAEHKVVLTQALADYAAAYEAFPADNRPVPALP